MEIYNLQYVDNDFVFHLTANELNDKLNSNKKTIKILEKCGTNYNITLVDYFNVKLGEYFYAHMAPDIYYSTLLNDFDKSIIIQFNIMRY